MEQIFKTIAAAIMYLVDSLANGLLYISDNSFFKILSEGIIRT